MPTRRSIRYRAVLAAAVVTATAAALAPVQHAAATDTATVDPFRDTTTVLFSSPNVPSGCYRIPSVTRAVDGTLLAFAEHRFHTCADKSNIETVVRRLPPGATEWLPPETVVRGEPGAPEAPATRGNPGPVVYRKLPGAPSTDAPHGRIVLLGTHNPVNPETPGSNHRNAPRTPYVVHSDDNGATWSQPTTLSHLDDPAWGHYATGPVHAIQLTRGAHAGRIIAGINYGHGTAHGAMLVYSDDAGVTWHRGARAEYPAERRLVPQEHSLVELANGDVMVWTRQNWSRGTPEEEADPNVRPHRAIAISKDGGATYHRDFTLVPGFEAPPIQSSALRLRATDEGDAYNRILTMAPSVNVEPRIRPTIRSSFDEGLSWQSVDTPLDSSDEGNQVYGTNDRDVSVEECACWGGYSDMVELPGGNVGLLYERGTTDYRSEIAFVRLSARDLNTPSRTHDLRGRTALAFDGVSTTRGRFGRGLSFDGQQGRVQLPYRTTPVLGTGDFTVSTWIRYDDTSRDQALFWAYGMNGAPQVWLRAEPGRDRLRGTVTTETGSTTVTSADAYADGGWHHVVLRRQGGRVSLLVDGVAVGTASGAAGAVRSSDPTPVYIGQRLDGANRFHGAMDEFRVYDRALSGVELTWLRFGNLGGKRGLTAHLPMNAVLPPSA
ncbi:sialidase family protein [Actinophytocola gossypii]|uniref:exo-alpha-sialidase n=1 Tax=Actinophytocola gossypii TaxID=2812003 RepID=A0ABT2J9W8_9PSEU|nr:sialidase family protein [Actinophytocola gossypii]MCT2584501.1 exo-alpha-sialidase [Actinophytocola gossypii]